MTIIYPPSSLEDLIENRHQTTGSVMTAGKTVLPPFGTINSDSGDDGVECDTETKYYEITYFWLYRDHETSFRDILCEYHMPSLIMPKHYIVNYMSHRVTSSVCNTCYFEVRRSAQLRGFRKRDV